MLPWSAPLSGRFDEVVFESNVLKDNPLQDPYQRPLWIYLPPGYDQEPERRYPSVYMIQGLTGQLDMWRNRSAFRKNFPELADELFARKEAPPCIIVWVDCWTSYGGSQFVDSPATGKYHTYLCDELVTPLMIADCTHQTRCPGWSRGSPSLSISLLSFTLIQFGRLFPDG